jgi:hypothetical protein
MGFCSLRATSRHPLLPAPPCPVSRGSLLWLASRLLDTVSSGALKAKVVIGNIRCQKEYLPTEAAFHSSEVPDQAREARLAVKQWKRPPVLGPASKPEWNGATAMPRPLCERMGSQLIPKDPKPLRASSSSSSSAVTGTAEAPETGGTWNISTSLQRKDWAKQVRRAPSPNFARRAKASAWLCSLVCSGFVAARGRAYRQLKALTVR